MGPAKLISTQEADSDPHTASSRERRNERSVGSEVSSAGAMVARLIAAPDANMPGTSKSDRPQQDTNARERSSATPSRAGSLKGSLGLRLMLFRRRVTEALSAMKHLPHAKETTNPTARDLKDSAFYPGGMSSDDLSVGMPRKDRSQHPPGQESNASASSSGGGGFKQTWKRCKVSLKEVADEAVEWSKLPEPAGENFLRIASKIEGSFIWRLQVWGTEDLEIGDPMFGDSSPCDLMDYLIRILERIMSSGEEIRREMDFLGSLARQGLGVQVGRELGVQRFLEGQKWYQEIEEMEALGSLAGQEIPEDLGLDL